MRRGALFGEQSVRGRKCEFTNSRYMLAPAPRLPAQSSGAGSWRLPEGVARILIVVGPVPLGLSKFGTLLAHISPAHASEPWFGISRNLYCF